MAVDTTDPGQAVGGSALKGASAGASFGPYGALIGGLVGGGIGLAQYEKGKKLGASNKRPVYEIPEEIKQNLTQAQMMALEGLPAQQKAQYIQNIQRSTQGGLNVLDERKGGLTGLSSLVQQESDAYGNLLSQDAAARQANQGVLMGQRGIVAQYKDKAFDVNKMDLYQQLLAQSEALKGAGLQNIMTGVQSGLGAYDQYQYSNALNQAGATGAKSPQQLGLSQYPYGQGTGLVQPNWGKL